MKKGVIFDMDGVLFDTERIYQECWWAAGCSPVMIIDTMRPDRELASICVGVFESLTEALEAIRQGRLTT